MEKELTQKQEILRGQLRKLSQNINDEIYAQRKYMFGKIQTIIEASTPDLEQRKSIKDLISDAIFGPSYWNNISFQLEQLSEANGFKLWEQSIGITQAVELVNQYEDIAINVSVK